MPPATRPRVGGHPRTGIHPGEKASEYPRLTIRLPEEARLRLELAARALGRQQWRVMHDALEAYLSHGQVLTDDERRAVQKAVRGAKVGRQNHV